MFFSTRLTRTAAVLALLAVPTIAAAQRDVDATQQPSKIIKQYRVRKAQLMVDYWSPRLNEYRQEIDRMLSATDLIEINELRARAGLLIERMKQFTLAERKKAEEESRSMSVDTTVMMTTAGYDTTMMMETASAAPADPVDEAAARREYEEQQREWERQQEESRREETRMLELVLGGDERAINSLYDPSSRRERSARSNERHMIEEESGQIEYVAKWIARNYRADIDGLLERFYKDMESFRAAVHASTREFYNANRAEIVADNDAVEMILNTLTASSFRGLEGSGGEPPEMIRSALEALFLVYNGQDLKELMTVERLPIYNSAAALLPTTNTLGQSSPNPASTATTVPYTLAEPGSHVVIEVVDTRGAIIATLDQGAREAGEHFATVDVTTLPAGTYLYHLKVTTAAGERVYSKSMTVGK